MTQRRRQLLVEHEHMITPAVGKTTKEVSLITHKRSKLNGQCIRHAQNKQSEDSINICTYTFSPAYFSRVRTPTIPSAHSSHPPLWNQTLITTLEHL